jgi:hypothetical protein
MGVPDVNLLWPSRIIMVTGKNPICLVCFIKSFFSKIIHPTVSVGGQLFEPQRVEDLRKESAMKQRTNGSTQKRIKPKFRN